jgi:hypothetical protein
MDKNTLRAIVKDVFLEFFPKYGDDLYEKFTQSLVCRGVAVSETWQTIATAPKTGDMRKPSSTTKHQYVPPELPDTTTYIDRFVNALGILCVASPSPEMAEAYLTGASEDLQHWVGTHQRVGWSMAIGVIEAAQVMANNPIEGLDHQGSSDDYRELEPGE